MRPFLRSLLLLLAWGAWLSPGSALAQGAAFSCDGAFYQIRQVNGTSQIFTVNRSSATYSTTPLNIVNGSNDLGVLINGLAYNSQDGYMYGLSTPGSAGSNTYNTISLYKIGQGGIVKIGATTAYVTVGGTPLAMTVASGTFDKQGNYYFSAQNTGGTADNNIYRLQPTSATPLAATRLTTTGGTTLYDIAYNPIDNNLYGVNTIGSLYQIAVSGTAATVTNKATGSGNPVGTAFFDVAGNMYAYSNGNTNTAGSGGFYQINLTSGVYTLISSIDPASVSDGASCINPGNSIDITKEVTNVKAVSATQFDISYAIRVRNTYTTTDTNVQVSDILTGSTNNSTFPTASSVSIVTAPAVTNLDGSTLVANASYTGLSATPAGSTISGASLLDGTQLLTAGQRAVITYTVQVTFASAAAVPTTVQNNTAYATSTAVGPNKGYTLNANGDLLSPNDLIAEDASTNSASFPALRPAAANGTPTAVDTESPTPVTFAPSISGTVFEDVNYGGGLGRSQGASQGVPRSGARVELYTVTAGVATYAGATTTLTDGSYSFTGLTANASYVVRVVSSTVTSSRNTGNATGLVGVQTYRANATAAAGTVPDPNRVGGEYPGRTEAANGATGTTLTTLNASTTTGTESIANVTLSAFNAPAVNVDFGYNFDTVVNTNDAGQGSLRQFITNANALDNANLNQEVASTGGADPAVGVETSIFMIPDGRAHDGLTAYSLTTNPGLASQLSGATNGVGGTAAVITPASALPAIGGTYGAGTSLDGTTQTQNVGNTNNVTLGTGGTVGTSATALAQLNGPEVQLTGSTSVATGLDVASTGTNTTIKGLAIYGFGNGLDSDTYANIRSAANNVTIAQNVLGTPATAFAAPATLTNADNVRLTAGTTGVSVTNNLIGFANGKGIAVGGSVTNVSVTGNEVRSNGQNGANLDGIDIQGSAATVTNNLFTGTSGQGIDSYRSAGSNVITGNTISDNGRGTASLAPNETPGVRIYGANNTISRNVISNNYGAGIMLEGVTNGGNTAAASTTTISQNAIFGNGSVAGRQTTNPAAPTGQVGIDLEATGDNESGGTAPYVTLNDNGDTDTGANGLLNFPVLTNVNIGTTALVVTGYARPGSKVELFLAQPNALTTGSTTGNNFGQGYSYLPTATDLVEGGSNDTNPGTGTYTSASTSVNQGTDNTNLFTFSIPLSGLTSAQVAALQGGSALLTSTATLANATSEFSGNLAVPVADVTASITGPTTLYAGQATGAYTATFTNEGPTGTATAVTRTVTLPTGASLSTAQQNDLIARYSLTAASFTTVGSGTSTVTTINFGTAATVAANGASSFTFAFTAPTTPGTTLSLTANTGTTASQGANNAPDQAALTLNAVGTADVTAAITTSVNSTTGTFNVTFGNLGALPATGVVPTVQLPAGLTLTATPANWSYNSTTGLLTYTGAPATFAANTPSALTVAVSYPLASAPAAPVTATASVSTATTEGGLSANNAVSATMPTQFDLTTTLTGPASTIAGSPTMLYVTTTNNGPNPAGIATQTVTLPIGLSNLFITNGGTYNSGSGVVTFPDLANLPGGQTVTNSISFLAPAAAFAPSAAVSTTSTTETNTTNNTAYLNGATSATNITVTTVAAQANEATTIVASAAVVNVGDVVTYTVTSTNKGYTGSTAAATNVTEKVQLLPGLNATNLKIGGATGTLLNGKLQFVSAGGTSTYDPTTGVLTYYNVPTQASGATTTYDAIAVTAPAAIGNGGQLVATASVSTDLKDNVPADNVASVGVRVRTTPDVATTITGPSSTVAGLPATYVVRFTNSGNTDAAAITETAQLPAGLSNVVVTDANGSVISGAYNSATGQITFTSLSPDVTGATQLFTIVLTAPGQSFPVSSTIASTTTDGVSTNNSASLTTAVTPNADLAVSVTGPATAVVGNPITYIVTTTNNGPTTATNAVTQLQLPKNLTNVDAGTATYTASTGLLTFPTTATLTAGNSVVNYVTFTMPSATATGDPNVSNGAISALASISSSGTTDALASNNSAGLTTSAAPTTAAVTDLATSLSISNPTGNPSSVPAGTVLTYTAAYRNTAGSTATNVVGTVNLPAGLSVATLKVGDVLGTQVGNIITFPSSPNGVPAGTTYNTTTGLLTFPTFATYPVSSTGDSYSISFPAPVSSGQLVVISEITSATTETTTVLSPNATVRDNRSNSSITINTVYDVTTTLTGPLTSQLNSTNTYTVTTLNNGPSTATNPTSQTVTGLPANLTSADLKVDGLTATGTAGNLTFKNGAGTTVATYSGTTLTFPDVASLPAGAANAAVHSFSLPLSAASLTLTATVASAGETVNTLPNSAQFTTTTSNVAPVAQNVWNTLQSARSNDANTAAPNGLLISPLNATDADGSIGGYTIVTVPDASQGKLYYNGGTTALANGAPITDPTKLYFAPTPGYVGNATFTYYATDNGNGGPSASTLNSPVAIYTIPVAADLEAPAYTLTPTKGGAKGAYVANDVIAYTADPNAANYGATGVVYSADGKTLNTNANNGITSASTNGTLTRSTTTGVTSLSDLGLAVDNFGRLYVSDPGTLASPKLRAGSYSVVITTIDANGGVTTQTVDFVIPTNPLPVVLTAFTASAVQNRDAKLSWTTASEINSAYFDVERSFDGTSFTKIGQVAAQGSTILTTNYAFTDADVAAKATGMVYYRLKQVDLDAKASYSPVRSVSFTKNATAALSLYPNPAQSATTLDLSQLPASASYQVLVLDATGRTVRSATLGGGLAQSLDLHELATGTYLVRVSGKLADGSALNQTLRLTKE